MNIILESETILKTAWNDLKTSSSSYDCDVINDFYPKFLCSRSDATNGLEGHNFISTKHIPVATFT